MSAPTWSAMLERWRGSRDPAVVAPDATWTGEELLRHAAGAADWFDAFGALEGEPLPALVSSSATAFALVIAGAATGRPIAPLGPRLTARELTACVASLHATRLLADASCAELAGEVAAATGTHAHVVPELAPSPRRLELNPRADSVAFVLHTSGTTGLPRAVPYREDRMGRRAEVNATLAELGPGSVFASASPFHHIAGWGNYAYALAAGATLVPVPRFTVEAWQQLSAVGTTNALLVPTMIEMLLDAAALDIGTLRFLHYGASSIHPDTLARVLATLPRVGLVNIYGQTEGSPITCLTPADHRAAAAGRSELLRSVGHAARGVELRIAELDASGVGEVWARGFHLMRPDADGWLHTGDLGRVDGEGYLYLVGRCGDTIIRGGENVHPQEVEQVLAEHPAVREATVVGMADQRWGERVKAFVVAADPAAPLDFEELHAWTRSQLAGFKVPTDWAVVDELPRNAAGKVLRRALAE